MTQDEEQLKLLSIFHYVVGGILGLFSTFPCIHVALGLTMVFAPSALDDGRHPPPALFGWFFVVFGLLVTISKRVFV